MPKQNYLNQNKSEGPISENCSVQVLALDTHVPSLIRDVYGILVSLS